MCGHLHNFLRMRFDFSDKYKVNIDMINLMNMTVDKFSKKIFPNDTIQDPENGEFVLWEAEKILTRTKLKYFTHLLLMLSLPAKIEPPELQPTIPSLCKQVRISYEND